MCHRKEQQQDEDGENEEVGDEEVEQTENARSHVTKLASSVVVVVAGLRSFCGKHNNSNNNNNRVRETEWECAYTIQSSPGDE